MLPSLSGHCASSFNNYVVCCGLPLTLACYFLLVVFIFESTTASLAQLSCILPVAGAVADINKMVAEGDSQNTLQALQTPSAGLRAVLSECADTYQTELAQRQTESATQGNFTCRYHQKEISIC